MVTTYTYDGLSRLTKVKDPLNNETRYEYDAAGNLTKVTDARNNQTTYSYNLLSQLLSTTDPLNKTTAYTYDLAGRLTEKLDPKGQKIDYTYDDSNYLAYLQKIDYIKADTSTEKTRSFKRNKAGQVMAYCDDGLIPGSNCLDSSTSDMVYGYQYDALGRMVQMENRYLEAEGVYAAPLLYEYKYDRFGNRKSLLLKVQGGSTVIDFGYNYNQMDQLEAIADGLLGNDTIGLNFSTSGKMSQIRQMNGTTTDFTYSPTTGQLTAINHKASGNSILSLAYSYDPHNNISQKDIDGIPTDYTYDAKDQLTQVKVNSTTTEQYTYDPVGNRLSSLEASSWTYNEANQLMSYSGGHTFTYDENGNMTQMSGSTTENLYYSVDDRLAEYSKGSSLSQYYYDTYNLRVKKRVDATDTYFLYDGSVLLAEMNANKTIQKYYTFMPGSYYPIAMNVMTGATINSYAYHNDHLMTPLRLTASDQSIAWSGDYKAFGEVTLTTSTITNNLRFPGQFTSEQSSLVYNFYRDYSPAIGRYLMQDPLVRDLPSFELYNIDSKYGLSKLILMSKIVNNTGPEFKKLLYSNLNANVAQLYMYHFLMTKAWYSYSWENPIRNYDASGLINSCSFVVSGVIELVFCWPVDAAIVAYSGGVMTPGAYALAGWCFLKAEIIGHWGCDPICSFECTKNSWLCMDWYNPWKY